ncbi:MAG: metallophosphoesterase [bacterium]
MKKIFIFFLLISSSLPLILSSSLSLGTEFSLNGDVKEIIAELKKEPAPDFAPIRPCEFKLKDSKIHQSHINSDLGGDNFTFVHLTDLHIGRIAGSYGVPGAAGDYGTPGYDDSPPEGDEGLPAMRLRKTVNWINANKADKDIRFVMVTGDITENSEKSEFLKAKEILDALTVPYVPIIGGHDLWPYTSDSRAPTPFGDRYFKEVFAPTFDKLKTFFTEWDDGTRLVPAWNSKQKIESWFQNYAFSYGGYHFICLDFNTRQKRWFGLINGTPPAAELYAIPGGTFRWLKSHYDSYPRKGNRNMLLFTHIPLTKDIHNFITSFSFPEYHRLTDYLNKESNRHSAGLWCAGHIHRNTERIIKTLNRKNIICPGIETGPLFNSKAIPLITDIEAMLNDSSIRLITVWGADSALCAENKSGSSFPLN